jgi:hypothetical protein
MKPPAWLTTLVEKGSVGHSSANPSQLNELAHLGIVCVRSAGIRRTVTVIDPLQLVIWLQARYPQHGIDPDQLSTREGNIVRSGGSKTGRCSHAVLALQFKWFGNPTDCLTQVTRAHGVAAVMSDRVVELTLPARWRLLTIENWEPFFRADYADAPVATMVVYLGGNVSDIVIEALKTFSVPPESVLHFGDYDWEGLYIFQRLQRAMPSSRLYVPENIEALFKQFGDRKLIRRQNRKAAFDLDNRECRAIIRLMEATNAGLEQEIVALPASV